NDKETRRPRACHRCSILPGYRNGRRHPKKDGGDPYGRPIVTMERLPQRASSCRSTVSRSSGSFLVRPIAIGSGATTFVFAVVDAILSRPPDAENLTIVDLRN